MLKVIDSLPMPYISLQQRQQQILLKIGKNISSQTQIAYALIEAGGAEDILQVQGLSIDGLNNSKDTTIQ